MRAHDAFGGHLTMFDEFPYTLSICYSTQSSFRKNAVLTVYLLLYGTLRSFNIKGVQSMEIAVHLD